MINRPWKHHNLKESFAGALTGIRAVFFTERYARILFFLGIFIILVGIDLNVSALELATLVIAIIGVCVCEIFNTLVENILDLLDPNKNNQIKMLKDMASAAVLLMSLGTILVAEIILLPKIVVLWKNFLAR